LMGVVWNSLLLISFVFAFTVVNSWTVSISSSASSSPKLNVEVTNNEPHNAYLLKWRTPFDELEGLYSFVVIKDEKQMEYKGIIALRLKPNDDDYVEFHSNQTRSVTVDLTTAFDFPELGEYLVQLVGWEPHSGQSLTSNTVRVVVTTTSMVEVTNVPSPFISFRNCDTSQRNILTPAWGEYGVAAGLMKTNVVINPQTDPLYRTWFGVYDLGRFNHVYNCINKLEANFQENAKEFYCNPSGCSGGVVAYVTSSAPNTIHICQLYFQLSPRDHIFVIVHEQMHFGAICGAPDYVYGRQGSRDLAISNPNNAVRNSDNYRFYGEDLYYGKEL